MANILEITLEADLLKPGDIYIFHETDHAGDECGPIEYVCFIKAVDEIMPAIKVTAEGVMRYEIKEYLGCTRVSEDCIGFTMRCFDTREQEEIEYPLYFHRVKNVQEAVKEAYDLGWMPLELS